MEREDAIEMLRVRPVPSFGTAMQAAETILELDWLIGAYPESTELWRELARIVADVYMHNPARNLVIDGEVTSFGYVQEIFLLLTAENLIDVRHRLQRYQREIKHKKAFVRTALYNTIFESETEIENIFAVTHGA